MAAAPDPKGVVLCLVCLEPVHPDKLGAHLVAVHAATVGVGQASPAEHNARRSPELLQAASMLANGFPELALAALESAVERDPSVEEGWFQKGMLHVLRNEHGEALLCFERALSLNDHDARVWVAKFFALERLGGRAAEAARCLIKAADLDPIFTQRWIAERFTESELGEIRKRYGAGGG